MFFCLVLDLSTPALPPIYLDIYDNSFMSDEKEVRILEEVRISEAAANLETGKQKPALKRQFYPTFVRIKKVQQFETRCEIS